ncbi:MAG: succinylglutamate desuccinylase/aspartoacylase family protein [Methanomicrobiales archaeon]|nr:succinylglutamate desuccinylase/aspartoacylase family protein [Methanomicrobiales archaeon]
MLKEIGSSIWQAEGAKPGHHVVVMGGTHGDERTGIEVVRTLQPMFAKEEKTLEKGNLTLILGNEVAIRLVKRATAVEHNLNRLFSEEHLAGPVLDFYESRRAHELAPILATADISIDIHSTAMPSMPFLANLFGAKREKVYRWFDTDIVLADPNFILGGHQASTDEYVESCGGIGICFETGYEKDTSTRAAVVQSILNILADQGLVKPYGPLVPPRRKYRKYQFAKRVPLTEAGFRYAGDYSGSFQEVKKGEVIGYHGDMPEIAEEDSAIVLQKSREKWAIGDELFFLARRVK